MKEKGGRGESLRSVPKKEKEARGEAQPKTKTISIGKERKKRDKKKRKRKKMLDRARGRGELNLDQRLEENLKPCDESTTTRPKWGGENDSQPKSVRGAIEFGHGCN